MPPVLGPPSPSPQPLEVLGRGQGASRSAVAQHQQRALGPGQALLDHHPPAGVPEGLAGQLGVDVGLGLGQRVGDQHALAGGQPVGLDHPGPGQACAGRPWPPPASPKTPNRAVGTPASASSSFMNALDPSSRAPSAPGPNTSRPAARSRSASPSTSGASGPMTNRSASISSGGVATLVMVWPSAVTAGDPGVARGHHHVGGAAEHQGQGVLAPARSDHAHRARSRPGRSPAAPARSPAHAAKRTNCSRPGPTPTSRTGVADLLGQEVHVVAGRLGQVADLGGARDVGLPPGQLLVDRGDLVEDRLVVGRVGEPLAVGLVGHAHLDRVEGVEHVELGQGHLGQRVEPHRLAHHHRVEPARPAPAAGVDPVLVAPLDQGVADLVDQLGGERARSPPGSRRPWRCR